MGSYSFFSTEQIEITDEEGLKKFLKLWKETFPESSNGGKEMYDEKKHYFTFENWNDIKLISYWYDDEIVFLNGVAKYLKGYVEWDFESPDERAKVTFDKGKCFIEIGVMEFKTHSPVDIFGECAHRDGDNRNKFKEFLTLTEI